MGDFPLCRRLDTSVLRFAAYFCLGAVEVPPLEGDDFPAHACVMT